MDKSNVILIGMPGAGKSTAGVILAKVTGRIFIDCDLVIQEQTGKLLSEIIAEEGAGGFIDTENRVISGIEARGAVIATGGSAVYGADAMANLGRDGRVVWLRVPFCVLERRLSDIRGRGVVTREGQTLRDIYDEREPLYRRYADITVDCADSIEDTVRRIAASLG